MTPYAPNITHLPVVRVEHSIEAYDWMQEEDHRSYYYTDNGRVELKRQSVRTWIGDIYTTRHYWVWELHHCVPGQRGRYQFWSTDGWEDKGEAFQAGIETLFNLAKYGIVPDQAWSHEGVQAKMKWHFFQELGWQGPIQNQIEDFPF
jgi:hypothetical protein